MSKNGPYPIKNGPYPSKHICLHEMFHKVKYLSLEKVILMESLLIIKNGFLKETASKGGYMVGFFNPPEKTLPAEKRYTVEWGYYSL